MKKLEVFLGLVNTSLGAPSLGLLVRIFAESSEFLEARDSDPLPFPPVVVLITCRPEVLK